MNLLETVSGLAVRHLRQEQLLAWRACYLSLRTQLYPVMRLVYGTFDTTALRVHLEQRLGTNFEILMVHSSVNNLKPMYTGTPLELLRLLMAFCGSARTLVMDVDDRTTGAGRGLSWAAYCLVYGSFPFSAGIARSR